MFFSDQNSAYKSYAAENDPKLKFFKRTPLKIGQHDLRGARVANIFPPIFRSVCAFIDAILLFQYAPETGLRIDGFRTLILHVCHMLRYLYLA